MTEFRTLFSKDGLAQWAFALLVCLVPLYASAAFFPYEPTAHFMQGFACDEYPFAAGVLCAAGALCVALSPLVGARMQRALLQKRMAIAWFACATTALVFVSLAFDGIAPETVNCSVKAVTFVMIALCTTSTAMLLRPHPKVACMAAIAFVCVFVLCFVRAAGSKVPAMVCSLLAATLLDLGSELRTEPTAWDIPVSGSREVFIPVALFMLLALYAASCVMGETPAFAAVAAVAVAVASIACAEGSGADRYASIVTVVAAGVIAYVFGANGHVGVFLLVGAMTAFAGMAIGPRGTLAGIGVATVGLALPVAFDMGNPYGHLGFGDAQHFFEAGDVVYLLAVLAMLAFCTLILALQAREPRVSMCVPMAERNIESKDENSGNDD